MRKKKIILSFDYELFFGDRSGTVLKSIIEPTNKLMDVMEQNGFRGNFFVDYLMFRALEKLTEKQAVADLKLLKKQIKNMVSRGHRVELHLHPHWVDAKYNGNGTWNFSDFTHYSLSSLDENTIVEMFKEGTDYLNNLAGEVEPGYKVVAFRAGGWAVQPFHSLKKAFLMTGLFIESSVMRGAFAENEGSYYDFRKAPNSVMGYYHFENDVCKEDVKGRFIEVPIGCVKKGFTYKIIGRIYSFLFGKTISLTDGTHQRTESGFVSNKKNRTSSMPLTLSRVNPINVIINQMKSPAEISCYIDHPKDFTNLTEKSILALSIIRKESILFSDILNNQK